MTDPPKPEERERAATEKVDPGDVPHLLSAYVQGLLTVHFERGAVATRRTSQFDARSFLDKQREEENDDDVTWETRRWFSCENSRVVFASLDASTDQNGEITPEQRRRLVDAGHRQGVVDSLVRMWERRARSEEPRYSLRAIASLHQMAVDGTDRRAWEAAARAFEGQAGALRLAEIWHRVDSPPSPEPSRPRDVSDKPVDEGPEPDEAAIDDASAEPWDTDSPVGQPERPEEDADNRDTNESFDPDPDAPA